MYQIRYDWVKDLLPRLHEMDAYTLSGWSADDHSSKSIESAGTGIEDSKEIIDNKQGKSSHQTI